MASALFWLAILVTAGALLEQTSALFIKKKKVIKKRDIFDEAIDEWVDTNGQVRFNLAPSYGTLTSKGLQQLDEHLKVLMGGILELDIKEGYTWKELRAVLDDYPLMNRQPELSAFNLQMISFSHVRFFGLGSNRSERLKYIHTWFKKLIGNVDILEYTSIDVDAIANMVSNISVGMIGNLWTDKAKKKNLMDLGILRFPDISNPFFALYRVNLFGKCTYKTYILHQQEKSEIVGLFQREIYYPDKDYIEKLSSDVVEQLLDEVDALFDF